MSVDSITTQNGQQLLMSNLSNLNDFDYWCNGDVS
jgi:hypothetical protein